MSQQIACCREFNLALTETVPGLFFEDGAYFIGTASTKSVAIRFCPWCRVNLRKRSQLESSARKVVNVLSDNLKEWDDLKDAIIKMSEYLEYER